MSIRRFFTALIVALTVVTGAGTLSAPANAATAAVDVKLTKKLTSKHKAKVKFCNNLNQTVDVWVGNPKHENDSFRRIWPHKCATVTTKRAKLGFQEYTRTQDIDRGTINTRNGRVSLR